MTKAIPESWLPDDAEAALQAILERYMSAAAIIGDDYGSVMLGTQALPGVGVLTAEVRAFLADYIGTFADEWVQSLASGISAAVSAGIDAGESMSDISQRVGALFDGELSDERAMMIARTETIRASNEGALSRYAQAGVERKEWSADGEGTCDDCENLDGVQVALGENFEGDEDSVDAPPLHPMCRCSILPVLEEYGSMGGATQEGDDAGTGEG